MRYALIQSERGVLSVARACHLLKVSASGYYAWQKRQQQQRLFPSSRNLYMTAFTLD